MEEIQRKDIHIISRHSDIDESTLQDALQHKIYTSKNDWSRFLKLLFISLGLGFLITGIIFFFAYNWDDLHKFLKLGIIQLLIISGVLCIVISKANTTIKNIVLTATSALVGALFAVFGQIYQTGANAYDFFLGWTVFITVWTIVGYYAPLWLLYSILLNTTLYYYMDQVASNWSDTASSLLFLALNSFLLISFTLLGRRKSVLRLPNWYLNSLAIAITGFSTLTITSLYDTQSIPYTLLCLLVVSTIYLLGVLQAIATKKVTYIALMAVSIILIAIYYIFRIMNDEMAIFFITIFSIAAFTGVIKLLLNLQQKWTNE